MSNILKNMKTRLDYAGGSNQQDRMIKDKLRNLRKALLYSYQGATAVLFDEDNSEFRCLINPDKLASNYDKKILSIPFEDIQLNDSNFTVGEENEGDIKTTDNLKDTKIREGTVFHWKETDTDWIVFLQHKDELAYFRASIERCRYEVSINGVQYKVYVIGPTNEGIEWNKKEAAGAWNNLNYNLKMTITADDNTKENIKRFTIIRFEGKRWEVQAVDRISTPGIIDVYLKEHFNNEIEDMRQEEIETEILENPKVPSRITGEEIIYPYDIKTYTINETGGTWEIIGKAKILESTDTTVKIEVLTGKSGSLTLKYTTAANEYTLPIKIDTL